MLNIPTSVQDPSYRYRMPPIVTKIEGRGNGIKTILPNLSDIADALGRPPSIIIRFMAYELGVSHKGDVDADRATLTGAFTEPVLQRILDKFIDFYVLCDRCHLPEAALVIKGKGEKKSIFLKCSACGSKGEAREHKLNGALLRMAA